jgi:predicted HD superfamily hydrolase involved in NAD metabolism
LSGTFSFLINGVKDTDILHAIRVHTTGEADMGLLDKILFVADYIEPNRCEAPRLEEIRKLAFCDLNRTVAEILYDTINFLNTKSGAITFRRSAKAAVGGWSG